MKKVKVFSGVILCIAILVGCSKRAPFACYQNTGFSYCDYTSYQKYYHREFIVGEPILIGYTYQMKCFTKIFSQTEKYTYIESTASCLASSSGSKIFNNFDVGNRLFELNTKKLNEIDFSSIYYDKVVEDYIKAFLASGDK